MNKCVIIFHTITKDKWDTGMQQHWMISIMNQITKIILRIILNKIKNTVREQISWEKYGFMEGK